MIVLQDEVNEKVVVFVYTGRENFCTDFKSIAAESCSGRWNSPKSGKKISGKGDRKKETVYHGKQSMEKLKAHNQEAF